ncbi:hypothetical protein MAR_010226 [Mya arenaria]|uniref:Uncharacterized protein n=1 Tax=Mya arenaria TaxID=6604 RepID=A0ABY7E4E7_MYAAR|nr:shootin-1-like [Mya arenaria]XP_052802316.1 shootin-1-like [Mya arenaria]WAR03668.1 hypothetical protein MAR_010226 [Mya arenaria]
MSRESPVVLPAGVEDGEEFDEPCKTTTLYCRPITLQEYEDQAETETQKAISGLIGYLDSNQQQFEEQLRRRKRQDLENGGLFSFVKVKVCDMIHGNNSPLLRVTEKEREKKLEELKRNMTKAFECSLETKGRRVSKRLEQKRQKSAVEITKKTSKQGSSKKSDKAIPPAAPPPPPVPPLLVNTATTPKLIVQRRKPFTPIENRLTEFKTPHAKKDSQQLNDTLGATPAVDVSLTSLHNELMSSHPWKRLKCVSDDKSPGGTPTTTRDRQRPTPLEPMHLALVNKFRNVRTPSPTIGLNTTVGSPSGFTPSP